MRIAINARRSHAGVVVAALRLRTVLLERANEVRSGGYLIDF
jgi:hypothetical protein